MAAEPRLRPPAFTADAYLALLVREGLWSSEPALRRYLRWLFEGVPLGGKRMLDVGGGEGEISLYAASAGAREVVCLEPESEGGSAGMNERFIRLRDATGFHNVRLLRQTFQAFDAPPGSFDTILLHNSINHLDEAATIRLAADDAARGVYLALFRKLAALLAPGGYLIVTDCARSNIFPMLGLPHPISRTIEWHKHQDPDLWIRLLEEAGLVQPAVSWSSYNKLGAAGWALLANRVGAFLTTGHFRLLMRKPA